MVLEFARRLWVDCLVEFIDEGTGSDGPVNVTGKRKFRFKSINKFVWFLIIALVAISLLFIGRSLVFFWLDLSEFGALFIRPIYFGLLGGLVLAIIALFRVDFKNRRSISWWFIHLLISVLRSGGNAERTLMDRFDFADYKLSIFKFSLWQVTKIFIGTFLFANVLFGFAIDAALLGWDFSLDLLPTLFSLPFSVPPMDLSYVQANVIPLIPALTLLIPPLLGVLFIRLVLLVGVTQLIRVVMPFNIAYLWGLPRPSLNTLMPTLQGLGALFIFWFMFTLFFPSYIDYNTMYPILGLGFAGIVLVIFALLDRRQIKRGFLRIGVLALIVLTIGSMMLVNNSVADARKLDMLGPYNAQLISVNQHLAELEKVEQVPYAFGLTSIEPNQINNYVEQNQYLLDEVRLWDQQGSFDKLRPEIGLIPYVDFVETDILRFNDTLYWSASVDLILPETVRSEDQWYASHFVYTNVPNGFLMLDAHTGRIVDSSIFFPQRQIYYGEGGLFEDTWVAYPVDRSVTDEIGGRFYEGNGGVTISPPLSWLFEPNFLLSYPTSDMHLLRYRDVYDRMNLLFPYFTYEFDGQNVDMWPVTDGENTFWAMPLITFLDTEHVPWSSENSFGRLAGYALIDIYNGDVDLIITGDDFFSELFKTVYSEYISTEVPDWLKPQLRYPEELINWRVSMYNFFHVTDPATYIAASEFYTVPAGLDTYYILSQPHSFDQSEFLGLLSLELRGALGENLAGYLVVRNDYPSTGEMVFYEVPLNASAKLLGPSAVNEALNSNSEFAQLKTLLRSPRVGDQIFYRIGDYDVFFLPVYTAPGGGVVTQLGTIATVGADFTGEYFVGLGSTTGESFRSFLSQIAGVDVIPPDSELDEMERVALLIDKFEESGLTVVTPTSISSDVSFLKGSTIFVSDEDLDNVQDVIDDFLDLTQSLDASRVFVWFPEGQANFGVLNNVEGILELHYIEIILNPP